MTLEKDDIDESSTVLMQKQRNIYFGHSCNDITICVRCFVTAASSVYLFHGTVYLV